MDSPQRGCDSGANLASPKVYCRFPCGGQKCDTVVGISVDGMNAEQIQHGVWTDSCERERYSGANPAAPKVNLRPPRGDQKRDIVVGFSAGVMIRSAGTLLSPPPLATTLPRPPPPPPATVGKAGAAWLPDAPRPQIHPEICFWLKNQK